MAEAELLPGLGEALLPWLDVRDDMSAAVVEACVSAAAQIGGPEALNTIARHSQSARGREVAQVFVDNWGYFEPSAYAAKVLRNVDLSQRLVPLGTAEQVTAAASIPTLQSARVEADLGRPDLSFVLPLRGLRDLDAQRLPSLRSAAGIVPLTRLRRLNLSRNPHLAEISAIADLPALRELYLVECPEIVDLRPVGGLPGLRVLCVDGAIGVADFSVVAGLSTLTTLSITDCNLGSLDICAGLPELRTLPGSDRQGCHRRGRDRHLRRAAAPRAASGRRRGAPGAAARPDVGALVGPYDHSGPHPAGFAARTAAARHRWRGGAGLDRADRLAAPPRRPARHRCHQPADGSRPAGVPVESRNWT